MNDRIEILGIDNKQDYFRKQFEQSLARLKIPQKVKILKPEEIPTKGSILVTVGDVATRSIIGDPTLSVSDCHSYIVETETNTVIPCLDYKEVFKDHLTTHWLDWSLKKAKQLLLGASTIDPSPHTILKPELKDVESFVHKLVNTNEAVSIDIECVPETCEITSIAFAASTTEVICIPLANKHLTNYWSPEEELVVWDYIQMVLLSDKLKIFQNFIFDTMILRYHGIETQMNVADTMIMASSLNPLLPKSLRDLGRIYLYCAPWKDNKDFKLTGDVEAFWRYNAYDASRTFTVYLRQLAELSRTEKMGHYNEYIAPLIPLVYDTCVRGVKIDEEFLKQLKDALNKELTPVMNVLSSIGDPLVEPRKIRKTIRDKENDTDEKKAFKEVFEESPQKFNPNSDKQIKSVLIALGYRIPTKKGRPSTDRESLLKLHRKNPHPFIENLLIYNRLSKLKSTYASLLLDEDKRLRFFYNIAGTISGRFSAQKTPWDTGLNILTIPRPSEQSTLNIKNLFIPDEGKILVEIDLSQAELRVVAWLSNEQKLIELMENNEDVHQYTADRVTEKSRLVCPRQLGKRINHASNYGMGAEKFSDSCLTEADLSISVADSRKLLEARAATFPAIPIWQGTIEAQLGRTRKLETPLHRSGLFYGPLDSEMVRKGLSFIPQATVVDTINKLWILLSKTSEYNRSFNVLAQIHDALLLQINKDKVNLVLGLIKDAHAKLDIVINGVSRRIPFDLKSGGAWGSLAKCNS